MKKLISLLLAVLTIAGVAFFTVSCSDPLQKKIDEMDEVYAKLGDGLFRAYEAAYFCGATEDAAVTKQFKSWKADIKAAKNAKANYLKYDEEELQGYIDSWNALLDEMNQTYDKYKDQLLDAKATAAEFLD